MIWFEDDIIYGFYYFIPKGQKGERGLTGSKQRSEGRKGGWGQALVKKENICRGDKREGEGKVCGIPMMKVGVVLLIIGIPRRNIGR